MLCPFCDCELLTIHRHGIQINRCPHCGGKWFDRGELNKLMRETLPEQGEAEPAGKNGDGTRKS